MAYDRCSRSRLFVPVQDGTHDVGTGAARATPVCGSRSQDVCCGREARLEVEPMYAHEVGDAFGRGDPGTKQAMWSLST